MGTRPFVVTNRSPLFVAQDILSRYGVYTWDSSNWEFSHAILLGICHSILDKLMVYWHILSQ